MKPFTVVGQHVARNPVARAVSRAKVRQAVTDFLLQMYLIADRSKQEANVKAASTMLAVAIRLLETKGQGESPDARVMAGAMSALAQCATRGFVWHASDAAAIDAGVTRAQRALWEAKAGEMRAAWAYVEAL